jgi:hypothetical protein
MHRCCIFREMVGGVAIGPAALLFQCLRQIPVIEGEPRHDVLLEQLVDQLRVEGEALLVDLSAVRAHARPGSGEAVGLQPEVGHERNIVFVAVVMVAGNLAVIAVHDGAGNSAKGIPDRIRAAVLVRGALDLVCGRGRSEEKILRERARDARGSGQCCTVGGHGGPAFAIRRCMGKRAGQGRCRLMWKRSQAAEPTLGSRDADCQNALGGPPAQLMSRPSGKEGRATVVALLRLDRLPSRHPVDRLRCHAHSCRARAEHPSSPPPAWRE